MTRSVLYRVNFLLMAYSAYRPSIYNDITQLNITLDTMWCIGRIDNKVSRADYIACDFIDKWPLIRKLLYILFHPLSCESYLHIHPLLSQCYSYITRIFPYIHSCIICIFKCQFHLTLWYPSLLQFHTPLCSFKIYHVLVMGFLSLRQIINYEFGVPVGLFMVPVRRFFLFL